LYIRPAPAGTGSTAEPTGKPETEERAPDVAASGATSSGTLAAPVIPDDDTLQALSLFFFTPIREVESLPDVPDAPAGAIEILIGDDYDLFLK
jgi:hypothetical protein